MKIRKCVSAITVAVALIALSLSDALAAVSTSPVSSPMTEPEPYLKVSGDHLEACVFYVVNRPQEGDQLYRLVASFPLGTTVKFCFTFPSGNNSNQRVRLWSSASPLSLASATAWDVVTGNLILSESVSTASEAGGYTTSFRTGYFPRTTGIYDPVNDFNYGYPIYPSNMQVYAGTYPEELNVVPFVTWSIKPPDHNVYHSHLSEPTSDKYNRYFVVDDRLYWISCQLNGFFIRQDVIESTSRIGSFQQMIGDSGSGWNSVNLSGVWYVPVDILSPEFSDDLPFYLTLVPSQNDFKVVLQPYDFINGTNNLGQYYLQASFYISEFNLEDGSYVTSVFQEFNQSISVSQYLNFSLPTGSSIHCYGINFYNIQNLPYNLSDVQWEYDLEFVTWRDQMLQQLQEIYALLSSSDSVPETTTYQNFGAEVASGEPSFSDLNAEDVKFQLDQAAGAAADLQPASNTVKGWISDFMPFKLMIPVIFALAFGVVILILGKNKSDT